MINNNDKFSSGEQRALAKIISELANISWQIVVNTDIGTNSCLFFKKVVVTDQSPRDGDIFTFSLLLGYGKLLLIDVPRALEQNLVESIADCPVRDYEKLEEIPGVGVTSKMRYGLSRWLVKSQDGINVRKIILNFIETARKHKYELVSVRCFSTSVNEHF